MYRSTTSFTTTDYDVRPKQILEDDFTTQDEIQEFLRIGYIEIYDDTIDITENGIYDVEDYQNADVNVPSGEPTLQSKDVTINQNGTTTVTADQGYDGLSDVDVTVNVPIPTPTLELYDVLDLQHTSVTSYDTDYIPNENTEIFVEYEDWYTYVSSTNAVNLFGVRYGTRQSRTTSTTWTNALGFGSYNYGNFKFGNKELRTSTSNKLADIEGKIRLKLNKIGIYKYNYNITFKKVLF